MNKRAIVLIGGALALGVLYCIYFTDWFKHKEIQIGFRPTFASRMRGGAGGPPSYTFYLDGKYPLTSIKVFSKDELATNKYPHMLWHIVNASNAVPTEGFDYGKKINGMRPALSNATANPLVPGGNYRVVVEAGKIKGQKDFSVPAGP